VVHRGFLPTLPYHRVGAPVAVGMRSFLCTCRFTGHRCPPAGVPHSERRKLLCASKRNV